MHNHSDHSHYHIHTKEKSTQIVVGISIFTMLTELYFGYFSGSVALLIDGWHMLSHVLVMMLAWGAYRYIRLKRGELHTALAHRILSLSGFASALILLIVTIVMIVESIHKFSHLGMDVSNGAILVATIGIAINGASAYFLHREEEHRDANLYAAYLHVLSDVVLSFLALISLLAAKYFQLLWLDPVCGILGSIVIFKWAVDLIRKSWKEIMVN